MIGRNRKQPARTHAMPLLNRREQRELAQERQRSAAYRRKREQTEVDLEDTIQYYS